MQKKDGAAAILGKAFRSFLLFLLASSAIVPAGNMMLSLSNGAPNTMVAIHIVTVICRTALNLWFLSIVVRLIFGLARSVADGDSGKKPAGRNRPARKKNDESWRDAFDHIQARKEKEPEYSSDIERKQARKEKELERKFGIR